MIRLFLIIIRNLWRPIKTFLLSKSIYKLPHLLPNKAKPPTCLSTPKLRPIEKLEKSKNPLITSAQSNRTLSNQTLSSPRTLKYIHIIPNTIETDNTQPESPQRATTPTKMIRASLLTSQKSLFSIKITDITQPGSISALGRLCADYVAKWWPESVIGVDHRSGHRKMSDRCRQSYVIS